MHLGVIGAGQAVHQAEIGDLHVVADQKEITRLDIQMLQVELQVHEVQDLGGLAQVGKQIGPRHALLPLAAKLLQELVQIVVGQLGDDDQLAADAFNPVHREQKRVADGFDMLDRAKFFLGADTIVAEAIKVPINKLDGLENAARGLAFPDFAKASRAKRFEESIPANRFRVGFFFEGHNSLRV